MDSEMEQPPPIEPITPPHPQSLAPLAAYEDGGVTEAETVVGQTSKEDSPNSTLDSATPTERSPLPRSDRRQIAIPPSPEDEVGKAHPHIVPELEEAKRREARLRREDSEVKKAILPQESMDYNTDYATDSEDFAHTVQGVIRGMEGRALSDRKPLCLPVDRNGVEEGKRALEAAAVARPRATTPVSSIPALEHFVENEPPEPPPEDATGLKIKIPEKRPHPPSSFHAQHPKGHARKGSMSWSEFYDSMVAQSPGAGQMSRSALPPQQSRAAVDILETNPAYAHKVPPSPVVHRRQSKEWVSFTDQLGSQELAGAAGSFYEEQAMEAGGSGEGVGSPPGEAKSAPSPPLPPPPIRVASPAQPHRYDLTSDEEPDLPRDLPSEPAAPQPGTVPPQPQPEAPEPEPTAPALSTAQHSPNPPSLASQSSHSQDTTTVTSSWDSEAPPPPLLHDSDATPVEHVPTDTATDLPDHDLTYHQPTEAAPPDQPAMDTAQGYGDEGQSSVDPGQGFTDQQYQYDQSYYDPNQGYQDPCQSYVDPSQAYQDPEQAYAEPAQAYQDRNQAYQGPSDAYAEANNYAGDSSGQGNYDSSYYSGQASYENFDSSATVVQSNPDYAAGLGTSADPNANGPADAYRPSRYSATAHGASSWDVEAVGVPASALARGEVEIADVAAKPSRPPPPPPKAQPSAASAVASSWGDSVVPPSYEEIQAAKKAEEERKAAAEEERLRKEAEARIDPSTGRERLDPVDDPEAWKKYLQASEGLVKKTQQNVEKLKETTTAKALPQPKYITSGKSPTPPEDEAEEADEEKAKNKKEEWTGIADKLNAEVKAKREAMKPKRPPPPPKRPARPPAPKSAAPAWDDPNATEYYASVPSFREKREAEEPLPPPPPEAVGPSAAVPDDLPLPPPEALDHTAEDELKEFLQEGGKMTEVAEKRSAWRGFGESVDEGPGLAPSDSGFFSRLQEGKAGEDAADPFAPKDGEGMAPVAEDLLMEGVYDPFDVRPAEEIVKEADAKIEAEREALDATPEEEEAPDEDAQREDESNADYAARKQRRKEQRRKERLQDPTNFEDDFYDSDEERRTPSPLFEEDDSADLPEFPPAHTGDGFDLMLRYPIKKKMMADRYWKPVVVRLHGAALQLFNDRKEAKPFHELPLQSSYSLSDVVLQQYDIYGKIHTAKLQFVKYQETLGVRAGQLPKLLEGHFTKLGMPLEHAATSLQLLKFGCLDYREMTAFVRAVEDVLFRCSAKREEAMLYKQDECQVHCYDEYEAYVDKEGCVSDQKARVRLFCLAFLSGMPLVEIGLNDRRRDGKEVVRRKDIMPMYTDRWIRTTEGLDFHCTVAEADFDREHVVKLMPPDGCFFEFMRFRVRPPKAKELPLSVRSTMKIAGSKIEIRVDVMVAGFRSRKAHQVPCEDIQIRFPIPEAWIYLFREERHWGYGSVHAKNKRPGKVKNMREKLLGMVGGEPAKDLSGKSVMEAAIGEAKYEHVHRAVVWRIPRLPEKHHGAYKTHLLTCRFELSSFDLMPETFSPTVEVEFTMPMATVSHTVVRSVSLERHEDPDRVEKFVRYISKYAYQVETDYVQVAELDMDAVMDPSNLCPEDTAQEVKAAHRPAIDASAAKDAQEGYRIDHPKLEFTAEEIGQASYRIEGSKGGGGGVGPPPIPSSSDESDEEAPRKPLNIKIDMSGYGY